ncbi:cytochrome P450 [Hoeflea sp. TYP-13]|uniref:cytochrome P450 n=1 Tax=Hoeflea sp. TYP-13 TaxID=3230023 RepID=UPI0034C5C7E4
MTQAPVCEIDLYSDEFIADPWPGYAEMRKLGAVVWLPVHGNYALTRSREVREAVRDHERFCSGHGVAADRFGCEFLQGNTVASDQPRHTQLRNAMAPPLRPDALEEIRPHIEQMADELVASLTGRDGFDAVSDLAQYLPLTIVRDMVGLPDFGKSNMLKWAAAAFNVLGVQNGRGRDAVADIREMREFISDGISSDTVKSGSWIRRIFDLEKEGGIDPDLTPFAVRDYINPSLDTTISAIGHLIWQLGSNPGEWEKLKENPNLVLNAIHEAVRMGTPVRTFSRRTTEPVTIDSVEIPEGARVMMLFASANRDERVFENPDTFDISRNNRRHLGFGAGIHMCIGMHLALIEMTAVLKAMLDRVDKIEVGTPTVAMNNTICAFSSLPAKFR